MNQVPSLVRIAFRTIREVTVEPVLFFYMLGMYLLFSVFQNLVYQQVCNENYDESVCSNLYLEENKSALDFVQEESSHWIRLSTVCMVLPSIVVDCYMGSWSDVFGRKLALVLPPIGAFLGTIVYILQSK